MKTYITMETTDVHPSETANRVANDVNDPKKPKVLPGQYVIQDTNGKVRKVVTITGQKTPVEQSHARDSDINNLLEPAIARGLLRHSTKFEGEYDDIPAGDFQEAQFIVAIGRSMFEALPAEIRNKFNGQPTEFMAYVQNPENRKWLRENGLLKGLDGLDKDGQPTGYNPEQEVKNETDAATAAPPAAPAA